MDWPKPPPNGLLPGWLLPNAEVVELKENAAELAPNRGVLAPNSPPEEEAPPKLNAIAEAEKARVLE